MLGHVYYYVSLWEYITSSTFVAAGGGGNMKDMRYYPNDTDSLVTHYISANEPNQGTVTDYGMGTEPNRCVPFFPQSLLTRSGITLNGGST